MTNSDLSKIITMVGEKLPKKHGAWFRLKVYDNHYLILDSWNGYVYHYPNGAEPTDTNNMYRCVYTFLDRTGNSSNYERVKGHMNNFWYGHICHKGR
jgi:hypothetical protein